MRHHVISTEETRALYRAFRAGAGVGYDIPGKRALDAAFLRFLDDEAERDTEPDGEA